MLLTAPAAAWSSVPTASPPPLTLDYGLPTIAACWRPASLGNHVSGNVTADADGGFRVGGFVPDTSVVLQAEVDGRVSDTVNVRPA